MLHLYNTLLWPLIPPLEFWSRRPRRDPASRREWAERMARRLPAVAPGAVWLHGASLGEARLIAGVVPALARVRPELGVVVSSTTVLGRAQLPQPPAVRAGFFAPLDLPGRPRRLLRALRPAVLALIETELWPNWLVAALAEQVPVVVLNGRLSERRMRRYRGLRRLYRPLLAELAGVGAQSQADADRFAELGVPPQVLRVTGNMKWDLEVSGPTAPEWRARLGLTDTHPIVAAGSTAPGEDGAILEAFALARRSHPDLLLVLAPRHLRRLEQVEHEARLAGWRVGRLSQATGVRQPIDVLLVDTVGDLASLYAVAQVAFVGGSLVPVGGHNLLEPASLGVPVLFGPHCSSVADVAQALEVDGGAQRVADAEQLGRAFSALLHADGARRLMGQRAAEVVEAHRGALDRSIALLFASVDRYAGKRPSLEGH